MFVKPTVKNMGLFLKKIVDIHFKQVMLLKKILLFSVTTYDI